MPLMNILIWVGEGGFKLNEFWIEKHTESGEIERNNQ